MAGLQLASKFSGYWCFYFAFYCHMVNKLFNEKISILFRVYIPAKSYVCAAGFGTDTPYR